MFNTSKDQTKRDFERAGEALMEGDFAGAKKDLSKGASHTKDLATQDNRSVGEKIGDNVEALGDKMKSAGHQAQAKLYDAKAEASKSLIATTSVLTNIL